MARPCRRGLRKHMVSNSEFDNADVYFASRHSGCSSRAQSWPEPIRHARRSIKKLQKIVNGEALDLWALDEVRFQQQGSRCECGAARRQRSNCLPSPHAQKRGVLRRRAVAGWHLTVSARDRAIQWGELLELSQSTSANQP